MGVRGVELLDKQKDPYAIGNHGEGSPFVMPPLVMQELDRTIRVMHHQSDSVIISVEGKLCATRPIESDGPKHCCPILLIEKVSRVN